MLPAYYQPSRSNDSGKRKYVFAMYGHGGHLEYLIMTILAILVQQPYKCLI